MAELFGRATEDEQRWLRGLVTGEVRQGALDALVQEALAAAAGVPLKAVRRAAMLAGSTVAVALAAFEGEEALAAVGLEVGRPVLPMLASSATDVAAAIAKVAPDGGPVAVDTKLDGIRIQVHRDGDDVLIATRSLDDITHRLPEVVALARSLPAERFVLDGEAIALDDAGRPRPFQETASRTAQDSGVAVSSYFFDLLHLDGRDLLDAPGSERLERPRPAGARVVPGRPPRHRRPGRGRGLRHPRRRGGSRGRGREEPVRVVRRRAAGCRLGQGQAGPHPRPRGARRSSGALADARAGSPTSTSAPATRPRSPAS